MHFIIISLISLLVYHFYATNLLNIKRQTAIYEADNDIIIAAIKRRTARSYLDADKKASNSIYCYYFFFIQVVRLDCLPRVGKVAFAR